MADDQFYSFERLTGMPNPNRELVQVAPKSKEISKEAAALKFVTDNYNSPVDDDRVIAEQAMQRLNISETHLDALKYATELEDAYFKQKGYVSKIDPTDYRIITANRIKNKIYDTVAQSRPALDVQGVSNVNRFAIKNLIDNEPELQREYLNRQGYQTRIIDGEVEVKKPGDMRYSRIDPTDLDINDVTDVMGDVIEGAITGSLEAGALATGGLPAAAVVGGLASAGTEALRQKLAKKFKLREEYNPNLIATAGGIGAATGFALPALGKVISKWGAAEVASAGKLKENAMQIATNIEKAGLEPVFAQLVDNQNYTNLFRKVVEGIQTPLNKKYADSMRKAFDDAKVVVRSIVDGADFEDTAIKGTALKEAFSDDFKKLLAPSEALYNESFDIINSVPFSRISGITPKNDDIIAGYAKGIMGKLESLKKSEFAGVNDLEGILDKFIKSASNIKSIEGIKQFRTTVAETLKSRDFPTTPGAKGYLRSSIIPYLTQVRSDALHTLAKGYDIDAKVKMFDKIDSKFSGLKQYKEFNDLAEEIYDSLDTLKEYSKKRGANLFSMMKSSELDTLSQNIDEYIDVIGNSALKNTKEFQSLKKDYLDYMDVYSQVNTSIDKLAKADELYTTAREGINALFSKTGNTDVYGEPKQIFKKYIDKLPSDDFIKKIIDTKNVEKVEAVKRFYPEAFKKFKKAKLGDIFMDVIDQNNDVNITKFKQSIKKLSDGEKIALFGDEWANKVDGLDAFLSTLPPKLNTSGTAIWYELMNWDKWYSPISEPFKLAKSGFEALRLKRIQDWIETGKTNREKMVEAISKRFRNTPLGYASKQAIREPLLNIAGQNSEVDYAPTK